MSHELLSSPLCFLYFCAVFCAHKTQVIFPASINHGQYILSSQDIQICIIMYQMRWRYQGTDTNKAPRYSTLCLVTDDTHDASVTGADVGLCLRPGLPDTEVVCLLLELGEVEGPGLLPAEVHLARGLGGQPQLPPPPEGAAEHGRRVILELINNFIKVNEKKTVGSFVAFFVGTSVT